MAEDTSKAVSDALSQLSEVGTLSKKVYVPTVKKNKKKGTIQSSNMKTKKKKKKKKAFVPKRTDDRISLLDDLFNGLDDSMKVKQEPANTNAPKKLIHLTKEARKQREMESSLPVSIPVVTADGVFTKGSMERLVREAKKRKVRQAKIAKKNMQRKIEKEKKAAELEKIRMDEERKAREEKLKEAALQRQKHRDSRPTILDEDTRSENLEAQEDELEALEAMYPDEYVKTENSSTFKIVFPSKMTIKVHMPETYPSASPPMATLEQADGVDVDEELKNLLEDMWIERDGSVILFEWLEELKEKLSID